MQGEDPHRIRPGRLQRELTASSHNPATSLDRGHVEISGQDCWMSVNLGGMWALKALCVTRLCDVINKQSYRTIEAKLEHTLTQLL